jgi:hypothetical protein
MVEARWSPSKSFRVTSAWPPGEYLLKLVGSDGSMAYVPLTLRDDASTAALLIQSSVTTWQAYNLWGGYDLYHGPNGHHDSRDRSRVVSFDRPYGSFRGAAGLWLEEPMIALVEKLGLDVTYWTDVDFSERPALLAHHHALVTLQHDEYWSAAMRHGALAARADGVNIAFFGANADYRHIRLAPSPLGKDREEIDYKDAQEDPLYGIDNARVTSDWRDPPVPRPESVLNGALYGCSPVNANMVIVDASSWVFTGTGLRDGSSLPGLISPEYDRVRARYPTPRSIQILAHSPLTCRKRHTYADMTYYTTRSDAGVIDTGTLRWIGDLGSTCVLRDHCTRENRQLGRITSNLLDAFAVGPAGRAHPSRPNLHQFGIVLSKPLQP